jgi:hypothetical protein
LFGQIPAVLVQDDCIFGRQKKLRRSQERQQDSDAVNRKRKANRAVKPQPAGMSQWVAQVVWGAMLTAARVQQRLHGR